MQKERDRIVAIKTLPSARRMVLKGFNGRDGIQTDEARPLRGRHAHSVSRWVPPVLDADPNRLGRKDFKCHGRVGCHLRSAEDLSSSEIRVIAGSAAKKLIVSASRKCQLLNQLVRMTSQRIG